ncbi:putative glycoside hydrolase family 61 protein [Lyophyllum shimeji]|uniref:lytic cellulose monooxygenase (C4-dehydrogenating) n=1 Tax=Lyophyllum shimeji TaxID=47721 RepID=A0A9P3UIL1_LYOSH|nr:putative glycoside hydrolase family 61 protein [Lyophyllum shimeji]
MKEKWATGLKGLVGGTWSAVGHGFVQQIKVGSEYVNTWNPYKDPQQHVTRISRVFPDNGPIPDGDFTGVYPCHGPDITCNRGGNIPVKMTTKIPAGTTIQFLWTDWQSDHPGPIMTYIAECPKGCSTFKVYRQCLVQVKIQEDVNSTWPATIPATLRPGEYLLRHEILGLQRATEVGRAQFYPACHQITVTGSGTKALPAGIALPGNYTLDDPGILLQYRDISATNPYTPLGGRVWRG